MFGQSDGLASPGEQLQLALGVLPAERGHVSLRRASGQRSLQGIAHGRTDPVEAAEAVYVVY